MECCRFADDINNQSPSGLATTREQSVPSTVGLAPRFPSPGVAGKSHGR
jgi:hypothetical protein